MDGSKNSLFFVLMNLVQNLSSLFKKFMDSSAKLGMTIFRTTHIII